MFSTDILSLIVFSSRIVSILAPIPNFAASSMSFPINSACAIPATKASPPPVTFTGVTLGFFIIPFFLSFM